MKVVIYIFMLIWVLVGYIGMTNPAVMIRSFHNLSKILGIDPDNIHARALKFFRILSFFIFVFGALISVNILKGKITF